MFSKWKQDRGGDGRDAELRRMFEAASDDAPPGEPPPFFAARIRAEANARRSAGDAASVPLGVAAARALPIVAAVAIAVGVWAGVESTSAADARADALSRIVAESRGGDVLLAAMLFEPSRHTEASR